MKKEIKAMPKKVEVTREKINEVTTLIEKLQKLTGKKVMFEAMNKVIFLSEISKYCSASFDFIDAMRDTADNMLNTQNVNGKPTNVYVLKDWFYCFTGKNYQEGSENFEKSEPKGVYQELKAKG